MLIRLSETQTLSLNEWLGPLESADAERGSDHSGHHLIVVFKPGWEPYVEAHKGFSSLDLGEVEVIEFEDEP